MQSRSKQVFTNAFAKKLIEMREVKAKELGIAINTAVVDDGENLVFFSRMNQAPILSIDIATNKAYTAAAFGLPTHKWYPLIKEDNSFLYGIKHTPKLVIFGEGYPIRILAQTIGAIGVSGGSVEQNKLCCQAALTLLDHENR